MADSLPPDEELFDQALARPISERRAFLSEACVGNEELYRRVEALIKAHDGAGDFLGEAHLDAVHGRVRRKIEGSP